MLRDRHFRPDLYHRLNVFPISLPPLRARSEDIPALVDYFVRKFSWRMNQPIVKIPREAVTALQLYDWPGNIRELENFVERAVSVSWGAVLRPLLTQLKDSPKETLFELGGTSAEAEREHILRVQSTVAVAKTYRNLSCATSRRPANF
jgi:formate hydrogenlyase transcriptional activator